jgi:hypothetical protein
VCARQYTTSSPRRRPLRSDFEALFYLLRRACLWRYLLLQVRLGNVSLPSICSHQPATIHQRSCFQAILLVFVGALEQERRDDQTTP